MKSKVAVALAVLVVLGSTPLRADYEEKVGGVKLTLAGVALTGAAILMGKEARGYRKQASRYSYWEGQRRRDIQYLSTYFNEPEKLADAIRDHHDLQEARSSFEHRAARYEKITVAVGALALSALTSGSFLLIMNARGGTIVYQKKFR